jgi:CRP/FNR family cyclic AMP-dependent transcriptional regulator
MKPTALLVNISRAELIEPDAWSECLNRGRPGMAAVDVFESEPILQGHALLRLENCICTPHIGYVEQDSYELYFGAAFDNVINFIKGHADQLSSIRAWRCRFGAPQEWIACAKGAVRVSSTSVSGKLITLTYVEPGIWFGDVAIFDGDRRTHDAYAHGDTTILCVARADFTKILATHTELYEALLRLHARRIRQLYGLVEDLNTLPLRARLAKQLLHLVRSYGVPSLSDGAEVRIGLHLAQEELAQLLGASRQRVNQELKAMEREDSIRIEPGGLVVRSREALMRISDAGE